LTTPATALLGSGGIDFAFGSSSRLCYLVHMWVFAVGLILVSLPATVVFLILQSALHQSKVSFLLSGGIVSGLRVAVSDLVFFSIPPFSFHPPLGPLASTLFSCVWGFAGNQVICPTWIGRSSVSERPYVLHRSPWPF